jgi:hypothetical protein
MGERRMCLLFSDLHLEYFNEPNLLIFKVISDLPYMCALYYATEQYHSNKVRNMPTIHKCIVQFVCVFLPLPREMSFRCHVSLCAWAHTLCPGGKSAVFEWLIEGIFAFCR